MNEITSWIWLWSVAILSSPHVIVADCVFNGADSWAINQSYAQDPVLTPAYYDPTKPAGSRFNSDLPASTIPRLYHSSATLLPDGSIFIAGSNPNSDVINATVRFSTFLSLTSDLTHFVLHVCISFRTTPPVCSLHVVLFRCAYLTFVLLKIFSRQNTELRSFIPTIMMLAALSLLAFLPRFLTAVPHLTFLSLRRA